MSEKINLGNGLSIHVVKDLADPLLSYAFYENLYNNVFIDENNNTIAGVSKINSTEDIKAQIRLWLKGTSKYMFFLYKDNNIIGTTQAFEGGMFGSNSLSLGYIVGPAFQGKGYGTVMLKFVSEYLKDLNFRIVLGFRDGNVASERIAAKNNYTYLSRLNIEDQNNNIRPMTYYEYQGKTMINESYSVIPSNKLLTTNKWIEEGSHILSRVNPKMLSLEEFIYLSSSVNKPVSLEETYFIFSTPHYTLKDKLKKEKIDYFGITDKASKRIFNPAINGDIELDAFQKLIESKLKISETSEDKTSMILESDMGEVKIKILDRIMLVEDYVIT